MSTDRLTQIPNEYAVELTPPDISAYKTGTGSIPYVHTFKSDAPGPHVAITAVVHGNEPCGAIALDALLKADVQPERGTLSLAFANVAAYETFDPANANASRWVDEDFNRLWSADVLDSDRTSNELERARAFRPFVDTVDLLLDIHSMQHRAVPLMMAGPVEKGRTLALEVGVPDTIVSDGGHGAGRRMRDYEGFSDPASPENALLVECGQHWEASAGTLAVDTAILFLRATGVVAPDFWEDTLSAPPGDQRVVEVTHPVGITTDAFAFTQPYTGMEVIERAGTVIGHDGDRPVETPYDNAVLIMPSKRLWKGQTAVRIGRFV
ncbi:MAG: succinylglutamate desuccinylase/aspartoacylase family protein [Pseudomonadota bacterium]